MGMEAPPPMPFAPNMAPPPPPPPPAGIPMQRMAGAGRPNIIVLNNQKPSRKNNKTFSFRKARRTRPSNDIRISMPSSPPPPYFKETSKDCPPFSCYPIIEIDQQKRNDYHEECLDSAVSPYPLNMRLGHIE